MNNILVELSLPFVVPSLLIKQDSPLTKVVWLENKHHDAQTSRFISQSSSYSSMTPQSGDSGD
ncbi:MAG: hypothetical protein WBM44_24390 [Waterburya sp.]